MGKREHDRHSQTGVSGEVKKHGAGAHNWGAPGEEISDPDPMIVTDPRDPNYVDEGVPKPQGAQYSFEEMEKDVVAHGQATQVPSSASERPVQHIIVAVDGSPPSQYAFQWVVANMVHPSDVVTIVHVRPDYGILANVPILSDVQKLDEALAAELVREYTSDVKVKCAEIKADLLKGDPGSVITAYCNEKNPTLLVMGTHGRSGFAKFLLGSVSDEVVKNVVCPVTVVKTPPGWAETNARALDLEKVLGV